MAPLWLGWPIWLCFAMLCSLRACCLAQKDALYFPLRRRDGGLIARGLLRNATLPLHGAVKDYGYFYATLMLGTPARSFAVIVDTGSTITYVPCATCGQNCGPHHKDAAFDPVASSSSTKITCGNSRCVCGRPACTCSSENLCMYSRTYAEQSSSAGVLVEDKMQLGDGGMDVVFGCETKETGEIFNQEADGIMGLGNSEVSVVNQLAGQGVIDDVFSLCFGSVEGDGALLLGEVDLTSYNVELEYTPLLTSAAYPHYYSVQLMAVTVGSAKLNVPMETYEEGYGTVLDSGTTFTYLPTEAFRAFRDAVTAFAVGKGLKMTKGPDPKFYDICFGGAPHVEHADQLEHVFPHLDLNFKGGLNLRMGPLNYLFMHTAEAGAYCLGVFDNGKSGTLLGGITFRNILVQYDRRNRRVGFGTAPCQMLGLGQKPCPNGSNGDGSPMPSVGEKCTPTPSAAAASPAPSAGAALLSWARSPVHMAMITVFFIVLVGMIASITYLGIWIVARTRQSQKEAEDGQPLMTLPARSSQENPTSGPLPPLDQERALLVTPLPDQLPGEAAPGEWRASFDQDSVELASLDPPASLGERPQGEKPPEGSLTKAYLGGEEEPLSRV